MADKKSKCRCRKGKRKNREGWHCHHELAEVRRNAAESLTPEQVQAAKKVMGRITAERPEERRDLPLPRPITVVVSPPPGSGKRK